MELKILFKSCYPSYNELDIIDAKLQNVLYKTFDIWDLPYRFDVVYVDLNDDFAAEFCECCMLKDIPYITVSLSNYDLQNPQIYAHAKENLIFNSIDELNNKLQPLVTFFIAENIADVDISKYSNLHNYCIYNPNTNKYSIRNKKYD